MENQFDTRQETSLRDFLDVLFRRKWLILSILVLATAFVVILNARQPHIWESSSRVLVRRGEQQSVLSGNVRYLGWEEEVASEIQVILSEDVFSRARAMFADSVAARHLPAGLSFNPGLVRAEVVGESNAFVIRYSDTNPATPQLGCEVVTRAYHDFYRERKNPPQLADFFASEIADVRRELEDARTRRQEFMDASKFYGSDETSRFLLTKISNLEQRLSQITGEVTSQQLRVGNLSRLSEKSGSDLEQELSFSMSQHVLQSGIVQNIKFALQNLNLERDKLTQMYTDKHPEVVAVDEQIARLHEDLKKQVQNAYQVEKNGLEDVLARRASILDELAAARAELGTLPDKERQLAEMDATIKKLEDRHGLMLQRQGESEIAQAGHTDWEVVILTHAGPPYSKSTRDYVRLAIGPLLSLVVGFGIAFFLESMDHSIKNAAEAEEYLEAPVLVTISDLSARPRSAAGNDG
ncbi:MAG TPA: Wzz/FepE/Etk N-terminal domain-containing protein [Candidatus Krumholzibacteria bacterium]|nr:Wzz/FepE/Etk N-terminal domain-containing protein [Candidatus Krumholzibacteria bacterium]